jgi:hypothetical protein
VVRWGETWTPGANWATTIATDRDLHVDGRALAKGKYSVWLRTAADSTWTLLFARTARRFHLAKPDSADVALRVPVRPERTAASEEVLTWSFPDVRRDTTTLRMQWTTAAVALRLSVDAPPVPTLAADVAARYVGTYRIRWDGDTASYRFDVRRGPNGLQAVFDTLALAPDEDPHMDLIPIPRRPNVFAQGDYQKGRFVGVETNVEWRFTVVNGRATAVETYALAGGSVHARGARTGP